MPTLFFRPLALAALLCAGAAQAALPHVETSAFTLQGHEDTPDSVVDLVSDTAQAITLALPTFAAELSAGRADSFQSANGSATVAAPSFALYDIRLNPGYRITGVRFNATVSGSLVPGSGDWPGSAYNYLQLDYAVWHWNGDQGSVMSSDFQDAHQMTLASRPLSLDTSFSVWLNGYAGMVANSGYLYDPLGGEPTLTQSLASVAVRDATLTFTVAPVPEPQVWLMLLSGLVGVSAAAWRSRQRA